MKRFFRFFWQKRIFYLLVFLFVFFVNTAFVSAEEANQNNQNNSFLYPTPKPCGGSGCPYVDPDLGIDYECAVSYEDWKKNPEKNFWVEDLDVTILGKNAERTRQFIYWVLDRDNIYYNSGLVTAWSHARNVAFSLAVLVVAFAGFLIIVSERVYTPFKVEVRDVVLKTAGMILFILFSFTISVSVLQIADIVMKFFIENMDVTSIFNIFFTQAVDNPLQHSEKAYAEFIGCKNLSTVAQESVKVSMFLINITNLTYYIIGIIFLLREIVLWFLIIASPFVPLLLYFRIIKNTGLIWIGVFLQWVFYGPLFALFLGSVSLIWEKGIPFVFDFSRINSPQGFIYPTAINILYGGPAQKLTFANTSSYVDTFVEYVISLLMLWVAIILPWWLLRIFRDYCCDGIYALKNLALSFYEKFSSGKPPSSPSPSPVKPQQSTFTQVQIPQKTEEKVKSVINIKNVQEIKQLQTEKILEKMNVKVQSLKDIALYETNKNKQQEVQKIIQTFKQPERVATPEERQKIIALKSELYQRASKDDRVAQRFLQVTSRSVLEQQKIKQELIKEKPVVVSVSSSVSQQVKLPQPRVENIFNSFVNNLTRSKEVVSHISRIVQVPEEKAIQTLSIVSQQINQPVTNITKIVQKTADLPAEKVKEVFNTITNLVEISKVFTQISKDKAVTKEKVKEVLNSVKDSKVISEKEISLPEDHLKTIYEINKQILSKENVLNQLEKTTSVSKQDIVSTVKELNTAIENNNTEKIKEIFTNKEKTEILNNVYRTLMIANEVVEETAKDANVEPEKIEEVVTSSLPVVAEPEKEVDKIIAPPANISIEEYENTKQLWKDHYLKGEIPISENIESREEWVERDIVILTNTLNKLLSDDPKLKEEGLDEVSYIIPLFLLNDMSLDDILVYLKAKVAAAKEVKEQLEREKQIREEVEKQIKEKEELVEVKRSYGKEEQKAEYLQQEIPEEEYSETEESYESGFTEEGKELQEETFLNNTTEEQKNSLQGGLSSSFEELSKSETNQSENSLSEETQQILDKIKSKLPDDEK